MIDARRVFVALGCCVFSMSGLAQDRPVLQVLKGQLQQRTNGVLALMGYSQTPDVTSGALSITDRSTDRKSVV